MSTLDDLRDALAEVEDKKPTQRLMAVINYPEEDDATMAEVAERYGYTGPWLSRWVGRLAGRARVAYPRADVEHTLRTSSPSLFSQIEVVVNGT